jgi:hypothetical protein
VKQKKENTKEGFLAHILNFDKTMVYTVKKIKKTRENGSI